MKKTVSIVGARGYSGLELARLLLNHPQVSLTHCYATREFDLSTELFHARAAEVKCLSEEHLWDNLTDVVFLATPAEVSLKLAPRIVKEGKTVIDLSGAFRLKKHATFEWYGFTSDSSVASDYGLAPFCGPKPSAVNLIANPGCYATAISMALIPLLKHGLIETAGLVIDAKSGTTGSGRKASEAQLFAEVDGECLPYKVGKHQHLPEIQEAIEAFSDQSVDPHFATHLLPVQRGILASIYARSKTRDVAAITKAYSQEFSSYPLVRFAHDEPRLTKLRHVVGTPYTHLSYTLLDDKLYLFSTIDNLLKGAASQAVENLNRCLDLPTEFSLERED